MVVRKRKGGDAIPTQRYWEPAECWVQALASGIHWTWGLKHSPHPILSRHHSSENIYVTLKALPRITIKPIRKKKKRKKKRAQDETNFHVFCFVFCAFPFFFIFPRRRQSWWTAGSLLLSLANKHYRIPTHISVFQTHCELYGPCSSSIHRANVPGVIHKPCQSVPKHAPLSWLI